MTPIFPFIRFLVKSISNTPLEIFDKNFGIIFGFIKAMVILSFINIMLVLTLWNNGYPSWIKESKSINIISYTSNIILNILPRNTLNKLKEIFKIKNLEKFESNSEAFKIEKYGEPELKKDKYEKKEGYSKNDNESLDKLFNIENN